MLAKFLTILKSLRYIPSVVVVNCSSNKNIIKYEINRWLNANHISKSGLKGFIHLMTAFPEFRSLVYFRTNCKWLRHFAKGQTNLYFHTPSEKIGKGLVIWHGYSTVINAESIGENCMVWHNVTIGKKSIDPINDRPKIGNNVKICTGSIVIGDIDISDGVTIGAGSVVAKSVSDTNAIVVGQPVKTIIR